MTAPSGPGGPSPSRGRLDQNVNPSPNGLPGYDSLVESMDALTVAVRQMAQASRTQLDQIAGYGQGPQASGARQARTRFSADPLMGMTRTTGNEALRSLEGAQSYVMQRLGEAIAGRHGVNYGTPPGGAPTRNNPPAGPTPDARPAGGGPPAGGGGGGRGGGGGPAGGGPGGSGEPDSRPLRQQIGQSIAESGTVPHTGAHGLGMIADLPGGGLYLDVVDEIKAQRAKNAAYQRVTGDTNFQSFGDRAKEEYHAFTAMLNPGNPLSGAESRQAFQGITALGYQGGQRGQRMDFIRHQAKQRGMSVDESLQALSIAAQNGKTNLDSLNDSLNKVSDAAHSAGVNADMARVHFLNLFGEATSQGLGAGANIAAATLQGTMTSYGRQFQNTDSRGVLSRSMIYRYAAQSGRTPGQFQNALRHGDPSAYRAITNNTMMMTANRLTPEQTAFITQRLQQYTNGNPSIVQTAGGAMIVSQIADEWKDQFGGQVDLFALADYFSTQAGRQLDPNNVVEFIVQQLAGNTDAARAQATAQSTKVTDVHGNVGGVHQNSSRTGLIGDISPGGKHRSGADAARAMLNRRKLTQTKDVNRFRPDSTHENKAGKAYLDRVDKTGQRDPVIEGLLQQLKGDENKVKVAVLTGDGMRVMSLKDAIMDFPNEVAKGQVQIVEGDKSQKGQTVSQILGGQVDASRDVSGETGKKAKHGQDYDKYMKDHPNAGAGKHDPGKGGVIDLSDEAKRWFKYLPNDAYASAASGWPQANPNTDGSPTTRSGG